MMRKPTREELEAEHQERLAIMRRYEKWNIFWPK